MIFVYLAVLTALGILRRGYFQCRFHSGRRCADQGRIGHVLLHAHLQVE